MMDFFDHRIESLARSSVSSSSFMELSSAFTLGEAKKPFFVCDDNVVCPFECFHPLAGLGWGLMEELPPQYQWTEILQSTICGGRSV